MFFELSSGVGIYYEHPQHDATPPPTHATPPATSDSGPFDWTTAPNGRTSYKVVAGDTLSAVALKYYGVADAQSYAAIALANPKKFNKTTSPSSTILQPGTLTILSTDTVNQIHTVQSDYAAVNTASAAVTAAKQQVSAATVQVVHIGGDGQAFHLGGDGHLNSAQAELSKAQSQLSQTQAQLNKDLQALLLPDPTQGYLFGNGKTAVAQLQTVLTDPGLQPYIKDAASSLQAELTPLFGKPPVAGAPSDPNSLVFEIQTGNWTAAERTEQQEITAAGKGASNTANAENAMALRAQQLVSFAPVNPQYKAGVDQAFDTVAVQPLVASLNKLYADPASQVPDYGGPDANGIDSRAGAFAKAFHAAMAAATPQVRVELMSDLLAEKNSPLLATALEIRAASNRPLGDSFGAEFGYQRQGLGQVLGAQQSPSLIDLNWNSWQISSRAELDQAYRDLAGGTDLAAVGDTVGSGVGMIHQVAQAILGDVQSPRSASSGANLAALAPSFVNAAADGNVNLSAEIVGILNQSGQSAEASSVWTEVSQGVVKFTAKVEQDLQNLEQPPTSMNIQIPVESVGLILSPQTTITATTSYIANSPPLNAEEQANKKQGLATLDQDGQAVVRTYYAIVDSSPAIANLPGAKQLAVANDNLLNKYTLTAVSSSPAALSELSFRQQQQLYAEAVQSTAPGPSTAGDQWATPRGFQSIPAGVFWIGRDVTSYVGQIASGGPGAPLTVLPKPLSVPGLNFDPTSGVAQQIDDLAQTMGGNSPVNIDAAQAEISQIKNRTITLNLSGLKIPTSAATQRIAQVQQSIAEDPNQVEWERLNRLLALSSDSKERLQIMDDISGVEAKSVNAQLQWMTEQAGNNTVLRSQISTLTQDYAAAQQRALTLNKVTAALQVPPTEGNVSTWMNRAGLQAGKDLRADTLGDTDEGSALAESLLKFNTPATRQLLDGDFHGQVSDLPSEVVDNLQQYAKATTHLGIGPKPGLVATTEGGLAFSLLKTAQELGGAGYLLALQLDAQGKNGTWLDDWFAGGLATFSVGPSVIKLGATATQSYLVGSDLSSIPGVGDSLTNLLSSGGMIDRASLFSLGISSGGTLSDLVGGAAGLAWTPMMYIWAGQEWGADPLRGAVVAAVGSSYLLPLLFAGSAWAGPASALIDIGGIAFLLANSAYHTDKAINQYNGAIEGILEQAGVNPNVAAALSKPDDQGISAAVRMGQIFNATPYYNTPNQTVNDQRRLAYLNGLSASQAAVLSKGLLNMPLGKNGQLNATGPLNLVIAPPPGALVMTPSAIQQYYENAYTLRGLQPPPNPSEIGESGVPKNEYLKYYEMYTGYLAESGRTPAGIGIWSDLFPGQGQPSPGEVSILPTSIQGFQFYASTAGIPLHGGAS
jgi:hypothetical protein